MRHQGWLLATVPGLRRDTPPGAQDAAENSSLTEANGGVLSPPFPIQDFVESTAVGQRGQCILAHQHLQKIPLQFLCSMETRMQKNFRPHVA
jgi:hypothetical protein